MIEAPPSRAAPTPAVAPSAVLGGKLAVLRRKHAAVTVLTGVALALVVGVEVLALAMFLDWWLDLAWGVRLALLLAQMLALGYLLTRYVFTPLARRPDEDELALMMERARPEFRGRLIASVQLTRPDAIAFGASPLLVDALVEQTEAIAAPLNFADIVPTDRLRRFGAMAILIPALALAGFVAGGQATADLLRRVFLSQVPVPRKTRVLVPEGDRRIGLGDSVRLEAFARGVVPASGKVRLEFRSGRSQELILEPDPDHRARFTRTIENVQDAFTYRVFLNDGASPTFRVKAIPRPTVVTIECEQHYPAYTGLPPTRRALGDLSLLAGSTLRLKVTATKEIANASLKLAGPETEAPLQVHPQQRRELTGQMRIPPRGLTGFSVQLTDTEGMASKDAAVYRVDIIPDKPPVVRLTHPDRKEELVTQRAMVVVGLEATDDFQVGKLRLKYQPEGDDRAGEQSIELDLEGEQTRFIKRRFEWKLGDLAPRPALGSRLEYWLEAEDHNDATGPGLGASEHQLLRLVSEADKRAELLNRAGDYLGSITEVTTDQERLNQSLGALIRGKTPAR